MATDRAMRPTVRAAAADGHSMPAGAEVSTAGRLPSQTTVSTASTAAAAKAMGASAGGSASSR